MQVVLAMFRSDGDRRSFSVTKDVTVIGRREDCDLRIPLGEISRKHCKFTKVDDGLRVEDLGSSNGTFVNGQRVQESPVQAGDTVQVGSLAFVVQIDGMPADEELHPVLAPAAEATQSHGSDAPTIAPTPEAPTGEVEPGEFDPMSILENGDSNLDGAPIDIDIEQSRHGQSAEA